MPSHATQTTDQGHRAAAERARILSAFRAVFGTAEGRTVLAVLQSAAGCLPGQRKPAFVFTAAGPACPIAAAFRAGRQSILDEIDTHLATPEDVTPADPAAKR